MKIYNEDGHMIARIDPDGIAHGVSARVSMTLTVQGDDGEAREYDVPGCTDKYCTECFFPRVIRGGFPEPAAIPSEDMTATTSETAVAS